MGNFFWDFETFNKRSRLLVVNQFLQTNMNVSVANFKYKNYGIQNYQHSFSVLLYNIAKSKKANLPVSRNSHVILIHAGALATATFHGTF